MTSDDVNLRALLGLDVVEMSTAQYEQTFTPDERQQFRSLMGKANSGDTLSQFESLIYQGFQSRAAGARVLEGLKNRQAKWSAAMDYYQSQKDWREEQRKSSPIQMLEPEWCSPGFGLRPMIFFVEEEIEALEELMDNGRCLSDSHIARLVHLRSIREPALEGFNKDKAEYERLQQEEIDRRYAESVSKSASKWSGLAAAIWMGLFAVSVLWPLQKASLQEVVLAMFVLQAAAFAYLFWRSLLK